MPENKYNISGQVDHLFRYEYGKLVSVLTKTFGPSHLDLAEDVVQEAMLEALNKWAYSGIPANPVGWIYQVARFKAINILKRDKKNSTLQSEFEKLPAFEWTSDQLNGHIFTDEEIEDDQLRMIFTCCHPSISSDSQIALTLKTLCGFSIPEIAHAFLTTEENINKRLVRARKKIREAKITFEVPHGFELKQRLSTVLETIYLLFNEGYNTSSGDQVIRYDVCEEAIRLAEIIAKRSDIVNSSTYALLALMSFNASRFASRQDDEGNINDLEHQDRNKWDQRLITKGLYYLDIATKEKEVSAYHILATISAHYCTSPSYKSIDWKGILSLYDLLLEVDDSPIVQLNRAVVISKISGPGPALELLNTLEQKPEIQSYLPYYTAKAELYHLNNEPESSIKTLQSALNLELEENFKRHIFSCLKKYSRKK